MKKISSLLLFLCFASSCGIDQDKLYGSWVKKTFLTAKDSPIEALILSAEKSIVIDQFGVKNHFDFKISGQQLNLENPIESWSFPIQQAEENIIFLDSIPFEKLNINIGEQEDVFGVNLLNLSEGAKPMNNSKGTDYYVPLKKEENGQLIFKLGDKISTIRDLPLFFAHTGLHRPNPSTMLLVDSSLLYQDLIPVYFTLKIVGSRRIKFITHSVFPEIYSGFIDNPFIWSEDLEVFQTEMNSPPPPPLMSRKDFLSQSEKIKQITISSVSAFELFLSKITKAEELVLINLEGNLSAMDYATIRMKTIQFLDKWAQERAQKIYQSNYDKLPIEKKKIIRNKGPFLLFEMRYNEQF